MAGAPRTPKDVAAVVCTLNSVGAIDRCLRSLRDEGVGDLVVVDAGSWDGTREIAMQYADRILDDPGTGLGNARNVGIACTSAPLVLNMGSDNVMPPGQLQRMIDALDQSSARGVSAQTRIEGSDVVSQGLNAWRRGRFRPGPADVIGTPTLFDGELLRQHPYDASRRFSDDSELCERLQRELGATFAISDAFVWEVGKATWNEVVVRCRMYGVSDEEVFRHGRAQGWSWPRQGRSLLHPLRSDLVQPLTRLGPREALVNAPFLAAFTAMRYGFWGSAAAKKLISG